MTNYLLPGEIECTRCAGWGYIEIETPDGMTAKQCPKCKGTGLEN